MITTDEPWMCGNLAAVPQDRPTAWGTEGWASQGWMLELLASLLELPRRAAYLGISLRERSVHPARRGAQ